MTSFLTTLDQLAGLLGTNSLTEWEAEFLTGIFEKFEADETFTLTGAQVMKVSEIWAKHFA